MVQFKFEDYFDFDLQFLITKRFLSTTNQVHRVHHKNEISIGKERKNECYFGLNLKWILFDKPFFESYFYFDCCKITMCAFFRQSSTCL